MSEKENIPNESEENEEDRMWQNMKEFSEKYSSIRAKMKKLEEEEQVYNALRERFVKHFSRELIAVAVDFYAEYKLTVPLFKTELLEYGGSLFDDVVNLCDHYKDEKPGYFSPLYEAKFEFTTSLDLFRNKAEIPEHQAIMDHAKESFEKEYVEGFYFECYRKYIHLLLKRLLPDYIHEIYDLPAQGFRDLDSFLHVVMLEIYDIINEAEPKEASATEVNAGTKWY